MKDIIAIHSVSYQQAYLSAKYHAELPTSSYNVWYAVCALPQVSHMIKDFNSIIVGEMPTSNVQNEFSWVIH